MSTFRRSQPLLTRTLEHFFFFTSSGRESFSDYYFFLFCTGIRTLIQTHFFSSDGDSTLLDYCVLLRKIFTSQLETRTKTLIMRSVLFFDQQQSHQASTSNSRWWCWLLKSRRHSGPDPQTQHLFPLATHNFRTTQFVHHITPSVLPISSNLVCLLYC